MIIIRISGGIGNQLFQYAFGRALSLRSHQELVLDISSYQNQDPKAAFRTYTLPHFNIHGRAATAKDWKSVGIADPAKTSLFSKVRRNILRKRESRLPLAERTMILEPVFEFVPELTTISHPAYLAGVWQSEKYFDDIADIIHSELSLREPLSAPAEKLASSMRSCESVAIHVRRGDQVNDPKLAAKHGLLGDTYYDAAITHIRKTLPNAKFFIFSDEIEWVRKNMDVGTDATYVSASKLPDYEELTLMSICKHQIIAKSSFSWWGAWLNSNNSKIVIAPAQRFGESASAAPDLIPAEWLKL